MPSDVVRVIYRKYDGSAHRDYPARRLAEDDLGTWLGVAAGTGVGLPRPAVRGADPVRAAGSAPGLVDRHVQPAAADQRDLLRHHHPGPLGRATTVHLIDLDLDVVRRRRPAWWSCSTRTSSPSTGSGSAIRPRWWPQAEAAARRLYASLADTEPFATAFRKWLALVT